MQAQAKADRPPYRRAGFEVAGWDGNRWLLEGIFDSGVEAAQQAKQLLNRRLGVKVTEEVFAESEGVFKSRVVFTEYRDSGTKPPPRKPAPEPAPAAAETPRPRPPRVVIQAAGNDNTLIVAITSLAISITALLLAMMR